MLGSFPLSLCFVLLCEKKKRNKNEGLVYLKSVDGVVFDGTSYLGLVQILEFGNGFLQVVDEYVYVISEGERQRERERESAGVLLKGVSCVMHYMLCLYI